MSNGDEQLHQRRIWTVALSASIILPVAGVILASLTLIEAFEGKFAARTVWGVLVVATGFITPLVPVILGMNRKRFFTLARGQQWILTTIIPSAFVLAIVLFMVCAQNSSSAIIGFTPTLFLRFDGLDQNGTPQLKFRVHGAIVSGGGSDGQDVRVGEPLTRDQRTNRFNFHARARGMDSRDVGQWLRNTGLIVELSGRVPPPEDGDVQITLDLQAKTKLKFQVDGLANVRISRDGEDVPQPVEFEPGQYTVVVVGNPTKVPTGLICVLRL